MASVFKRGGSKTKGYWYASWSDYLGKRRTLCTRSTDKATAERIARKHEADAALRRDGVIDPTLDGIQAESKRTLDAHLADYERMLSVNRSDQHVRETIKYKRAIVTFAGWVTAADIKADPVNGFSSDLREKDKSARTRQAYLLAVKGFSKWLTRGDKIPRDPLAGVDVPSPSSGRRKERRALHPDEWQYLAKATAGGPIRYGMEAMERHLLYQTAIQTGLRSNELRSLTRGGLFLKSEPPYVTCKAGSTKNRKTARQYILPELAAELRKHIARKSPKAPVFAMPDPTRLASMIRADLLEARSNWIDGAKNDADERIERGSSDFLAEANHDGEVFDFHILRHTCGAWLALRGENPKVVQSVMRHSAITLTMDTYGHLFPDQESAAVGRLEGIMATAAMPLAATGTTDSPLNPRSARRSAHHASQCEASATGCNEGAASDVIQLAKSPKKTDPSCGSLPSATIQFNTPAPLAQLAEQLTLNQ